MRKIIHYFLHIKLAERLPRLPRMYSADYDLNALTEDEVKLMKLSAIRSPHGVEIAKRRRGAGSARELASTLPVKHKPSRRGRLGRLVRRVMGTTSYDPMRKIYYHHRRRVR